MIQEIIKKQIEKDNYIEIAFRTYEAFKETNLYAETYKLETLQSLRTLFKENEITKENVFELAKKLQKKNPASGALTHWSNLDDLLLFAEKAPDQLVDVWNKLYDDSLPLKNRIDTFREAGQSVKKDIKFNAPFFGYLLAGFNYKKYPLYKGSTYKEMRNTYQVNVKTGSVSENYGMYVQICEIILDHLTKTNPDLTMLDVQDFLFCSAEYEKVKVESAVKYLYELACKLHSYKQNPASFLETIKKMDVQVLKERRDFYQSHRKVNKIRFLLIEKILAKIDVTMADLEEIKNTVNDEHETNILQAWSDFSILFGIYYPNKKLKVQRELQVIHQAIRNIPELQGLDFIDNQTMNGFDWNNSFGTDNIWLAAFEAKYENHRTAIQYSFSINNEMISYGIFYGFDHPNVGKEDLEQLTSITYFSYERFCEKFAELARKMQVEAGKDEAYDSNELFDVETWLNLLKNKEIFNEKDLEYIFKIYELGGEASATELANQLGKHPSSFNVPVVQLAKRILAKTNEQPVQNNAGKNTFWRVLFNGEYGETGHFKWKLKPNLKDALSHLYEEGKQSYPVYTKENFLEEVFIDEEMFQTITNLLGYKRNIILQGPPGVGKTFVCKRLAFALMGKKDESRVEMVQFHQSYAYEDFIIGFRPDEKGNFGLKSGVFYDFCKRAQDNPELEYYFIIDEINRGNLSKIFGELFMLIENNKRDEFVTLGYSKEKFTVPSNVYLIGTMNTADRSLAQLDVALRRRFSFITLEPQFNEKWKAYLGQKIVSDELIERIILAVRKINKEIRDDYQLGRGFEIGHAFFTEVPENIEEKSWFQQIIEYEIKPLLEEYYFDRPEIVTELIEGI